MTLKQTMDIVIHVFSLTKHGEEGVDTGTAGRTAVQ
jgi:hypothetical protein